MHIRYKVIGLNGNKFPAGEYKAKLVRVEGKGDSILCTYKLYTPKTREKRVKQKARKQRKTTVKEKRLYLNVDPRFEVTDLGKETKLPEPPKKAPRQGSIIKAALAKKRNKTK